VGSVLAAIGENFSDYEIYESNPGDLMVVAVAEGRVPRPGPLPEKESAFMEHLRRLGITRAEEISARDIGGRKLMERVFAPVAAPVNSDFYPIVQLEATRARFEGTRAQGAQSLALAPLPILEMAGGDPVSYLKEPVPEFVQSLRIRRQSAALEIARLLGDRSADPLRSGEGGAMEMALVLKRPDALCASEPSKIALQRLQAAAETTLGALAPERLRALWIERKWLACTPRSPHVRDRLEVYAAITAHDSRTMLERARALLAAPATGGAEWGRFLLSTALLGAHAAGEHAQADELWKSYGRTFYPSGDIPPYVLYLANLR